jgi:hypothetical protein
VSALLLLTLAFAGPDQGRFVDTSWTEPADLVERAHLRCGVSVDQLLGDPDLADLMTAQRERLVHLRAAWPDAVLDYALAEHAAATRCDADAERVPDDVVERLAHGWLTQRRQTCAQVRRPRPDSSSEADADTLERWLRDAPDDVAVKLAVAAAADRCGQDLHLALGGGPIEAVPASAGLPEPPPPPPPADPGWALVVSAQGLAAHATGFAGVGLGVRWTPRSGWLQLDGALLVAPAGVVLAPELARWDVGRVTLHGGGRGVVRTTHWRTGVGAFVHPRLGAGVSAAAAVGWRLPRGGMLELTSEAGVDLARKHPGAWRGVVGLGLAWVAAW